MMTPLPPIAKPLAKPQRARQACVEHGRHTFGVAAKSGPALPGDVQSGTRSGALISHHRWSRFGCTQHARLRQHKPHQKQS